MLCMLEYLEYWKVLDVVMIIHDVIGRCQNNYDDMQFWL